MKATLATRVAPPVLGAVACLIVWGVFASTTGDIDGVIALYILVVAAASALFLFLATERWRPQGLGLALFLTGVAWYFGAIGARLMGWRDGFRPWELDAIRSLIAVGSTGILGGLAWWAWTRRRRDTPDPIVGPVEPDRVVYHGVERRGDAPGRRATDWRR